MGRWRCWGLRGWPCGGRHGFRGEGKFLAGLPEAAGGGVRRRMGAKEVVWTARVALWRPPSSTTTIFSLQRSLLRCLP